MNSLCVVLLFQSFMYPRQRVEKWSKVGLCRISPCYLKSSGDVVTWVTVLDDPVRLLCLLIGATSVFQYIYHTHIDRLLLHTPRYQEQWMLATVKCDIHCLFCYQIAWIIVLLLKDIQGHAIAPWITFDRTYV